MKKILAISLMLALAAMLVPSAVFAAPPPPPPFSVVMDVASGTIDITSNGISTGANHLGAIGETNTFSGMGGFHGDYTVKNGAFGNLSSYLHVNSYAGGADFVMTDQQNFDVLVETYQPHVVGNFYAEASGNDANVAMNLKSIGTMYAWSEATDGGGPELQGSMFEKEAWHTQNGTLQGDIYMGVTTTGLATSFNSTPMSGPWGWGITYNWDGTYKSSTNYSGNNITSVSATGTGKLIQTGFGLNYLSFSQSYVMPGGGSPILGGFQFNNGISGTYSMTAK